MPRQPSAATSNAAWCTPGGRPASPPARSKATTPRSRYATDSRAISSDTVGLVVPERAVDDPGDDAEVPLAPGQPAQLGLERRLHGEPAAGAELRAVAHLEVAEPVARRILHHLVGHPLDRLGRLQQRDGVLEPREVVLQAAGVAHHHEAPERLGIGRRQGELRLPGELDHRRRAERAVEMGVQLRLGQAGEQLTRQHRRPAPAGARAPPPGGSSPPRARPSSGSSMPRRIGDEGGAGGGAGLERRVVRPDRPAHVGAGGDVHRGGVHEDPHRSRSPSGGDEAGGRGRLDRLGKTAEERADRLDVEQALALVQHARERAQAAGPAGASPRRSRASTRRRRGPSGRR